MKVERKKLLAQLKAIGPGLAAKEVVEGSTRYHIRGGTVWTFDDEVLCRGPCLLDIGDADAPAAQLRDLLAKLDEDVVDVSAKDGQLIVKGRRKRSGLHLTERLAQIGDDVEPPGEWTRLPEKFAEAIGIACPVAATDVTMHVLSCVHVHPDRIEACDNFQAVRYPLETGLREPALVRRDSLKYVTGMGATECGVAGDWVHFRNPDGLTLSCRRIEGQYHDLGPLLEVEGEEIGLPKGLADAVSKAEVFARDLVGVECVTVSLRKSGDMLLRSEGDEGWYEERSKVEWSGGAMTFRIAPKLLIEISQLTDKCVVGERKIKVETGTFAYITCMGIDDEEDD